jgi:hypothetical protein
MTCAASTMEAAATAADRASTVKAVAAVEFITSADYTMGSFATMESVINMMPVVIPTTAMIPIATAIVTAAIIRMTVEPMEPRPGPDEYSVREVVRAPISVGRASVRSIRVVAVGAHWRRPNRYANRTNSDSHSYLRARNSAHRKH